MQRGFTSQRPILAELEHGSFGDRARGERLGLVERSKSGETRGGTGRGGTGRIGNHRLLSALAPLARAWGQPSCNPVAVANTT